MVVSKSVVTFSGLAFALFFGGIVLYMNLGNVAKQVSEKIASQALGVPVTIGTMDIDVSTLKVEVRDLSIANPKGFKKPEALHVDLISVEASGFSKEMLIFNDITVSGTTAFMSVTPNGTNFMALRNNIQAAKAGKAEAGKAGAGKAEAVKEQPKVIIRNLAITDVKVKPSVLIEDLDLGTTTMPDIRMSGIGLRENGVLARDAIGQVLTQVSKNVNGRAQAAGMLQGISEEALKEAGLAAVRDIETRARGVAQDAARDIQDKVKGLFNY